MQPTSTNHRSLRDSMQYMAVILIIGGGIGLWCRLSPACLLWGFNGSWKAEAVRQTRFCYLPGTQLSLMPMLWLIVAALLLVIVRRLFRIDRWHGPADSIYAAHRTDNELDLRAGIGSTAGGVYFAWRRRAGWAIWPARAFWRCDWQLSVRIVRQSSHHRRCVYWLWRCGSDCGWVSCADCRGCFCA